MGPLFQAKRTVVIEIDNATNPTSQFFVGGKIIKVAITHEGQNVFTDVFTSTEVTRNISVNSSLLSGQVNLHFQHLARDAGISDEAEFQTLAFEHPAQMLEIASSLIRQGLLELKKEEAASETYLMYAKEESLMFFKGALGWSFYWSPRLKKTKGVDHYMYEIGEHCTVISLAK